MPSAKILYMSGYTDGAISRHGVLDPGIALLQKPFMPATVVEKIQEVLDASRRQAPGLVVTSPTGASSSS